MVFPNDLEQAVGLAGPTADIGHAAAHASSGIPATLERIQDAIGYDTATQLWNPTWSGGGTPSTNNVWWSRVANQIAVSVEFRWNASSSSTQLLNLFNGYPAGWGAFKPAYIPGFAKFSGSAYHFGTLEISLSPARSLIMSMRSQNTQNIIYANSSFLNGDYFTGSGVIVV